MQRGQGSGKLLQLNLKRRSLRGHAIVLVGNLQQFATCVIVVKILGHTAALLGP